MLQEKIIKQKKLDFNNLKDDVRKIFPELSEFELEKIVERNLCTNIFSEIKDVDEWFKKKVVEKKIFGENNNFSNLEKRRDFLNFLKNAENKNILINLKDLFFYKNNINKVKLFFIVLLPKNLIEKIFSLT